MFGLALTGIWVDASLFCNYPLDNWLQLNATDLILFRRDDNLVKQRTREIKPWVASWFMASPKQSYTLSRLVDVITNSSEFYRFRKGYHWWHRCVSELANSDPYIGRRISELESADPSHCIGMEWTKAPVFKRCPKPKGEEMYSLFAAQQRCCPHARTATGLYDRLRWESLCAKWNCSATFANFDLFNESKEMLDASSSRLAESE